MTTSMEQVEDDLLILPQHSSSSDLQNSETEEQNDEEVRALAASLAPQMEELETLLATPVAAKTSRNSSSHSVKDDDNMDTEWSQLKDSEQLLRQELEFAHDFSHLFDHANDETANEDISPATPSKAEEPFIVVPTPRSAYTLAHHARQLGFQVEPRGGWYSYPLKMEQDHHQEADSFFAKEYILPIPMADLKRLFVGLVDPIVPAVLEDHTTTESTSAKKSHAQPSLLDDAASLDSTHSPAHSSLESVLPVRTVSIRIRPDVLCGAVMDAVHHALTNLQAEVSKRQGGHLRGVVGPTRIVAHHEVKYDDLPSRWISNDAAKQQAEDEEDVSLQLMPPFTVDVQLCTYKGSSDVNNCERILLIRTYPITTLDDVIVPAMTESDPMDLDTPGLLLKETSALVQRIESEGSATLVVEQKGSAGGYFSPLKLFSSSPSSSSTTRPQDDIRLPQESISSTLIQHARPCPSVLEGGLTLPALSKHDWPVVQSSWRFIQECWEELSSRDLAHATLAETRFGAFPALPTLDVQYCSQIRRVCRESMVVSLLKSASELEQFARESEYSCASLIQTLKPTFEQYQLEPPALPLPLPLTAYPLDFTPPQVSCPPWGMLVMEALNQVAAQTSEANKVPVESNIDGGTPLQSMDSFLAAEKAVALVLTAFQRQDDEEQGARLGRKNVQVMDRLAKMQAHKRAFIHTISESYGRTPQSTKAADDFHSKALQALSNHSDDYDPDDYYEVPLFGCSILVGGTCYVTARHLLLVTQSIPLVGGHRSTLFDLTEIAFELYQPSRLMNPIVAAGISILKSNEVVCNFRPSLGAQRFKEFVEIIKEAAMENPDKLKFSDRGGLLYFYGDEPETLTKPTAATPTTAASQVPTTTTEPAQCDLNQEGKENDGVTSVVAEPIQEQHDFNQDGETVTPATQPAAVMAPLEQDNGDVSLEQDSKQVDGNNVQEQD